MSIVCNLVVKSTQSLTGTKMKFAKGAIVVDGTVIPLNVVKCVINNTVFYQKGSIVGEIESVEEKNGFTVYTLANGAVVTVVDPSTVEVIMAPQQADAEEEDEEAEESDEEEEEEEDSDDESEDDEEEEEEEEEYEEEESEEEDEDDSDDEEEEEEEEYEDDDEEEEDSDDDDDEFDL